MSKPETSANAPAGTIPIAQAARLLQIGEARVRQLQRESYIPAGPRGHVSLVGAVQGYLAFLQEGAARRPPPAANRVQAARARHIELSVAQRMDELMPIDVFEDECRLFVSTALSEIEALPKAFTGSPELTTRAKTLAAEVSGRIRVALGAAIEAGRMGERSRRFLAARDAE